MSLAASASALQNRLRPLAAESAEPDARLFHKPAIAEPENALAEVNPENATDLPEVFIHVFIPVAVSMMLTVPVAGFSRAGQESSSSVYTVMVIMLLI
ncbi:hypothetical protein MUTS15_60010 [Escherichia coli]|nr:hypothetical protein MUTS15_60010 [Escherichia coli]BDZ05889.1 hypothetical protein MUTS16_69620 [Escherichia coli]